MSPSKHVETSARVRRVAIVLALLGVALSLRLWDIGKESFWIDEVLTVSLSSNSVAEVLTNNAKDVHPPLYYLGLRSWRHAFGDSDAQIRAYSVPWSFVGVLAVFLLAFGIGGWRVGLIALILAAVNPFDIYYAQEARNYAQAAALCTLASWCLWRWMAAAAGGRPDSPVGQRTSDKSAQPTASKWWPWAASYSLCAAAALYTHFLTAMVLGAQGIFALIWFGRRNLRASFAGYTASACVVALSFLPWVLLVLQFRPTLYHPDLRWMEVPAIPDYYTFLGRDFFWADIWNMDHPWWTPTMVLPLIVLAICLRGIFHRDASPLHRPAPAGRIAILYPLWLLVGPLILIAATVAFYHPVFQRSRFTLFLLPPFLTLAALACTSLRGRMATGVAAAILAAVMLAGTWVRHDQRDKSDWRRFARVWQEQGPPAQAMFFPPNFALVVEYYLQTPVTSPTRPQVENILPGLKGADLWIVSRPDYDYPVTGEFDYYQWLLALGRVRNIVVPNTFIAQVVTVGKPSGHEEQRLDRWHVPFNIPKRIEGFRKESGFVGYLEYEGPDSVAFRWSGPKAWFCLRQSDQASSVILNVQFPPPIPADYRPDLEIYMRRGKTSARLFTGSPVVAIADYRAGPFEVRLPVPDGPSPLWIGWTVNPVNIARALRDGKKHDSRDLGLRVNWVGTKLLR